MDAKAFCCTCITRPTPAGSTRRPGTPSAKPRWTRNHFRVIDPWPQRLRTASAPQTLTIEEYLNTTCRPDCDFVDDHVEKRNLGTPKHALLQMELGFWFRSRKAEWKVRVMGNVRTRARQTRVRLPDVAIVWESGLDLEEKAMISPPLIATEILSPEDRLPRVVVRLEEFLAMGVPHVWVIDPVKRLTYTMTAASLQPFHESPRSTRTPIYLDLPELFSALD